ncbi:MAG: hypothetical protein LLG40_01750 [Deltaproteobacteria bacterium]|nr:hypothetical protein [Deltaproteobacteria bacterium]
MIASFDTIINPFFAQKEIRGGLTGFYLPSVGAQRKVKVPALPRIGYV